MEHYVQFDNGEDPVTHKGKPPLVAEFHKYQLKTADPKMQALIEGHPLFGKKIFRMEPGKALPIGQGTQYSHGVGTTASRPDLDTKPGEVQMSAGEKAALTRARKKVADGGELTDTEQAVWDKYGDKE
jgi:hypothetical protein